jgi:WbqC-like protein family
VAHFPEYIQVFSDRNPFFPDLSILDLLFCLGPKSVDYLRGLELTHLK